MKVLGMVFLYKMFVLFMESDENWNNTNHLVQVGCDPILN